jgi:hypothetical protein
MLDILLDLDHEIINNTSVIEELIALAEMENKI